MWLLSTAQERVAWPDITGRRQPIPDFDITLPPGATQLLTQSSASNNPGSWYKAGYMALIEVDSAFPSGAAEVWSRLLPLTERVWDGLDPTKSYRIKISPQPYFHQFQLLLYHQL